MSNYFKFTAHTINGVIQQTPQQFYVQCVKVKPIGKSVVRNFDGNECINAKSVFLILYEGKLLGNEWYSSFDDFMQAFRCACFTDYLLLNECFLELNDCDLILN